MTKDEARKLIDEVAALIGDAPGRNDWKLDRCRQLIEDVMWSQHDAYLSEKASTALEFLGYWFSPRKWQKWGPAENMRSIVHADVMKLESALDQHFRER